jgi:YD repeat-containing protein
MCSLIDRSELTHRQLSKIGKPALVMPFYCHLTSTVTTQQRITEQVFDTQGLSIETIRPDGSSAQTEYDAHGRVTAEIDALNQRRDLTYEASGRLSQVQLPAVPNPLNNNVSTRPTYLYEYNAVPSPDRLRTTPRWAAQALPLSPGGVSAFCESSPPLCS